MGAPGGAGAAPRRAPPAPASEPGAKRREVTRRAAPKGMVKVDVPGDGNCLFASIAGAMGDAKHTSSTLHHRQCRAE
eukprot:189763-Alexandrium_andersonii.AAC.1